MDQGNGRWAFLRPLLRRRRRRLLSLIVDHLHDSVRTVVHPVVFAVAPVAAAVLASRFRHNVAFSFVLDIRADLQRGMVTTVKHIRCQASVLLSLLLASARLLLLKLLYGFAYRDLLSIY